MLYIWLCFNFNNIVLCYYGKTNPEVKQLYIYGSCFHALWPAPPLCITTVQTSLVYTLQECATANVLQNNTKLEEISRAI